ncbi:MAG TPA: hypothetical protein VF753_18995 [Terriglobales bacterium]
MRSKSLVVIALILAFAASVHAQSKGKIYLDPDNSFSAYFSAAIQKKKVPITVTTDPAQADYTATFQGKAKDGSLLKDVLSTLGATSGGNNNSSNEVVMTIVNAKTKDVAFSYTCRKQSQSYDASSALATSVAECLAKHWKDSLK